MNAKRSNAGGGRKGIDSDNKVDNKEDESQHSSSSDPLPGENKVGDDKEEKAEENNDWGHKIMTMFILIFSCTLMTCRKVMEYCMKQVDDSNEIDDPSRFDNPTSHQADSSRAHSATSQGVAQSGGHLSGTAGQTAPP